MFPGPASVQALMAGHAQRHYDWCNFIVNRLDVQVQSTVLVGIVSTNEACFSRNTMYSEQNIHIWSLDNPKYAVEIRHQMHWEINVW